MRKTAALFCCAAGLLAATFAGGASADPANDLIATFSFACTNGLTFSAVGISQNRNTTGHIVMANDPSLSLNAIFQVKRIVFDGQVVRDLNGFTDRQLMSCTITAIDGHPFGPDVVVFEGFFTPNS